MSGASSFSEEATIYALASGHGSAGVSVIRLSGGKSYEILLMLTGRAELEPRRAVLSPLYHPVTNKLIDKALILYFKNPHSFTGEDVAELHIHGSPAIIRTLFSVFSGIENVRQAEPGEFSKRAFLNGKMDLTEAEAIADLVAAETESQAEQALAQMGGALYNLYEGWRHEMMSALAYIEADIDFSEDEIPENLSLKMKPKLEKMLFEIRQHLDDGNKGEILREGIKAAVIGAPNAGKSSLMNRLAKRDVAIVSDIAGTTRDVIETHLNIGGYPVILMDTAGLRETEDIIEKIGVERAVGASERADMKLAMFDVSAPEFDAATLNTVDDKTIVVLNKCDKGRRVACDFKNAFRVVEISAKTGDNIPELISAFKDLVERDFASVRGSVMPTRARHRSYLTEAAENIQRGLLQTEAADLMAEDVRCAVRSIGKITGRVDVEELLDVIFRDFCIGK